MTETEAPLSSNLLLRLLPTKELRALEPHLEPEALTNSTVLYEASKPIARVYFVSDGVVSLVKELEGGEVIEIATVGPEGMIGTTLALGSDTADHKAIVQVPGQALSMKASTFKPGSFTTCEATSRCAIERAWRGLHAVAIGRSARNMRACCRTTERSVGNSASLKNHRDNASPSA